jgi:transcriptional regulator with XRE-family HTH domain
VALNLRLCDGGWLKVGHRVNELNDMNAMIDVVSAKAPDQLDVALGATVRLRRRTLGMSQEVLADKCGVSFQQIQKYENGVNRISFSRLVLIAGALHCRVSDLVGAIDEMEGATRDLGVHSRLALPGAMELLEAFEAMGPSTRNHLMGLVRALPSAVPA